LAVLGTGVLPAQDHGSIVGNPFSTPEDVKAGAESFRSQCAACHGLKGDGGSNGPSLTTGTFRHGGSDEALFTTINKGVTGTPMVAFPLSGRDIWQLIAFIRSVNMGAATQNLKGNAAKGAEVFRANNCSRCHTVGSTGGLNGPDLTAVGSRRTVAQLQLAVVDPNAEVSPDYWALHARTKSGQEVRGRRMNEDMDTFQILEAGKLRSLRKSDLASFEIVHTSPMPSFKDKVAGGDLDDLVAYLASLKTESGEEVK
jgi:putative heme-binding domain-containing protein